MSTTSTTTSIEATTNPGARVLLEGYGGEAWHGPDLKAALADVSSVLAFWRPAPGRHNIAEIALHHAYYAHSVRGRLSETAPEPFVLEGEDWFPLSGKDKLTWKEIVAVVDRQQQHLATLVADIEAGRGPQPALGGRTLRTRRRHHVSRRLSRRTDTAPQEAARGRIDERPRVGSRFA